MHWQRHKHGRAHADAWGRSVPVAVAIGTDPVLTYAATAPLPPLLDEFAFAGFLRGKPVELTQAKTVDLMVPADAEFVLEGYVDNEDLRIEGPFGDHTGVYSLADRYPTFHVTCITHRRNPIYAATVVGKPPMEDAWLGKATERIFLPLLQAMLPEVVDMNLPVEGGFHNLAIVSIRKSYPGQAKKVMNALWGLGHMMMLTRVLDHRRCRRRRRRIRAKSRGTCSTISRPNATRDDARSGRRPRSRLLQHRVRHEDRHRRDAQRCVGRLHARVAARHDHGRRRRAAWSASAGATTDSIASRGRCCADRLVGARAGRLRAADEMRAVGLFLREIRIEHTLFALPFAYVGAILAARGMPTPAQLGWITLAVLGARTAAMAANRFSTARSTPAIRARRAERWRAARCRLDDALGEPRGTQHAVMGGVDAQSAMREALADRRRPAADLSALQALHVARPTSCWARSTAWRRWAPTSRSPERSRCPPSRSLRP